MAADATDSGGDRPMTPPRPVRKVGRYIASATPASSSPTTSVVEPPDAISTLPVKPMGDATQVLAGAIESAGLSA